MIRHSFGESGQAAPLYIVMVVSLLFLALAFFAVGQAGATRNSAQSGADAAALAAAQESRDQFGDLLLGSILDPDFLDDIFNGNMPGTAAGCEAAGALAAANEVTVQSCAAAGGGAWGFTVQVVTQQSMGDSILPGTEGQYGEAQATAIVKPRCDFIPAEDEETPPPPEGGDGGEAVSPGQLNCEDSAPWEIDPENLTDLPDMSDLFSVRLAED